MVINKVEFLNFDIYTFWKAGKHKLWEVCNDSQLPESICVKIEKLISFINNALFICSETYWIEKLKDEDSDEYYYDDY